MQIREVKPVKVGNSFYFTIPKQFMTNGIISISKKYDLELKEVDTNEPKQPDTTTNRR